MRRPTFKGRALGRRTGAALAAAAAVAAATVGLATSPAAAESAPPGYSVTGIDISSNQGPTVDWNQVHADGERFAYVKISEGSTYLNPTGPQQQANAKAAGLFAGPYVWPHPDTGLSTAVQQADFFMDHADYVDDGTMLPPMIDLDDGNAEGLGLCYGQSPADMVAFLHAFTNEVQARAGRPPVIYVGAPWWNTCTGGDTSFGSYPLDFADYASAPGALPNGWSGFAFWQFTGSGTDVPGVSSAVVDKDVFNGTLADLAAFCAPPGGHGGRHPYSSGRIVSARDADGRLETFAAGSDGIWHAWQNSPNGTWSNWVDEGGLPNAQLAIAPNADGRLELFAENSTELDHLWQTAPNAAWSTWAKLGGGGYQLAAGTNADGRIEVFASNSSGVFHIWQTAPSGGWNSSWAGLGGPGDSQLQMENAPDGRLEVFALSDTTFGHLWQTAVNGGWSAWETFGDGGTGLTVNHNADGRLEVFASNANGVFHKWQTSYTTWSDWAGTNGGAASSQLASSTAPDGRIEVFAINGSTATHLWQTAVNGVWSAWATFGTGGTAVDANENQDGHEEVFAASSTGVYHNWQTSPTAWASWQYLANTAGPSLT